MASFSSPRWHEEARKTLGVFSCSILSAPRAPASSSFSPFPRRDGASHKQPYRRSSGICRRECSRCLNRRPYWFFLDSLFFVFELERSGIS